MDGEWKADPTQPTDEIDGFKNNVISLDNFVTYEMEEKQEEERARQEIEMKYRQAKQPPSYDNFTGEPPGLPPYLRQIILNRVFVKGVCDVAPGKQHSHALGDAKPRFCEPFVLQVVGERHGDHGIHDALSREVRYDALLQLQPEEEGLSPVYSVIRVYKTNNRMNE